MLFLHGRIFDFIAARFFTEYDIIFTKNLIRIKRGDRWLVFDRNIDHSFDARIHEYAKYEQKEIELAKRKAARKGHDIEPKSYYSESCHIVLLYEQTRYDLMDVYSHSRAIAVQSRLQAIDRKLDQMAGMAEHIFTASGSEWKDQAGDLP